MKQITFSFAEKNVRPSSQRWLFKRSWAMRFEWLAFLAYKRRTFPDDQAWITLEEIAQLPSWGGKSRHDTSTIVGRYLQSSELKKFPLVTAQTDWSGPYRLNTTSLCIKFDVSLSEVRSRLQIRPQPTSLAQRTALIRFTYSFARAQWLVFHGRLEAKKATRPRGDTAYERLLMMVDDRSYTPELRLLALVSAVDVLFRLGRFRAARTTLLEYHRLLDKVDDLSLKARFHLKLAWAYQRTSSGIRSDRAVERALQKASFCAQSSGDRAALGLLARRTAGYRTKKGLHLEAINQLVLALEADLVTGNYDSVQITCGDIGSVVHRLGSRHYEEARRWLILSAAVARMMKLGRDDAHGEMILAKIYLEQGRKLASHLLLQRAERIAGNAGNPVNLGDVKMVWGFWYRRFGTRQQQVQTLVQAVRIFKRLSEFDVRQKERYMERSFPIVWPEVIAEVESTSTAQKRIDVPSWRLATERAIRH